MEHFQKLSQGSKTVLSAGISTATLQNGGVGLAPFHDWDSKIPADLKAQIQKASDEIKDGSITIDLPQ
jgi:basic membrane protein A